MTAFCINSKCSSPNTRKKFLSCKVWVDLICLSSQLLTLSSWLNLSSQLSKELLWYSSSLFTALFCCVIITNTLEGGRQAAFDRALLDNMSQKYKVQHISNCCEHWKLVSDPGMKDWLNPFFLVHRNTQIPFAYCSPIVKDPRMIRFCTEGVVWTVLMHLSRSNRSLKWF